jgi:DNA-binding NarL/FixJ family response regulator
LCEYLRQLRDRSSDAKFLVLDEQKSAGRNSAHSNNGSSRIYFTHGRAKRARFRDFSHRSHQLWVTCEVLPQFLREVSSVLRIDYQGRQTTTRREDEILELVRRRLLNREIADNLQIRVSTVKFHVSNILSKLHANNRRELTPAPSQKVWKMQLQ